ncbi:MAG TPA: SDR family NAD(P)-dependent oxidoreductase, partial [Opitutaceae bacterium]|nr:SDR family NAD(P)-dependent oxidoreductase [Opitutaceae bacterium]
SQLFIPHLQEQGAPAIILVTSGLAFVPLASVPVYCATKAALHSFALSMRHQLASGPIGVIEIAPPHVNTDLGTPGSNAAGMPLEEFTDAAMAGLARGDLEVTCGFSSKVSQASRAQVDEIFGQLNPRGR